MTYRQPKIERLDAGDSLAVRLSITAMHCWASRTPLSHFKLHQDITIDGLQKRLRTKISSPPKIILLRLMKIELLQAILWAPNRPDYKVIYSNKIRTYNIHVYVVITIVVVGVYCNSDWWLTLQEGEALRVQCLSPVKIKNVWLCTKDELWFSCYILPH